jgi:large subunit ribosomal protein L35
MRTKQGKSHLRRKKSKRAKNLFDEMVEVGAKGIERRVSSLAPYLKGK